MCELGSKECCYREKHDVLVTIPVLFVGGTEIHTLNLVKVLIRGRNRVSVCCYYDHDNSMVSKIKEAGAEVILMRLSRSDGLLNLFFRLKALFKKLRPDIIHVQYIAPGFVPIIAAKLSGVEGVFGTVHQPGRPYGLKAKILIRIASHLCNGFFCNSRSVEESWFADSELFDPGKINSRRKHFTIYNAIDAANISEIIGRAESKKLRRSLGLRDESVIGVVGRLRWEKGHAVLLQAMTEIVRIIPDTKLIVVGDGPDRADLERMVSRLGITSNVIWLGPKMHEEVFELYSIMDVVTVPSVFEGFGFSAAEAMAAGLPVVGARVDGLSEIIDDCVTGYLTQVGDSHGLANALIDLLSNEGKRKTMGERGKERVQKSFTMQHFARSIISVYEHFC